MLSSSLSAGENAAASSDPLAAWKSAVTTASRGDAPLSVVLVGDSNTEMNGYAVALRALLQGCYGDAGTGYQPMGTRMQEIPGAAIVSKRGAWRELDFAIDPSKPHPPRPWFALDGLWIDSDAPDAAVTVRAPYPARMRLYYQTGPELGAFELRAESGASNPETVDTRTDTPGIAYVEVMGQAFDVVRVSGRVVLLGVDVRRPGLRGGAIVHQLGNGYGMAHHFAAVDPAAYRLFLSHARPSLIVVMLGTNDMNNGWYADEYAKELEALTRRLRAAAPDASLVIVGCPSCKFDRMDFAEAFDRAAAEVAAAHHARHWSLRSEVGDQWRHWDPLGLMEYTLHYLPANGTQVALRLLRAVGFHPLDAANCPAWREAEGLLPAGAKPAERMPAEGWPRRPDRDPPRGPETAP